MDMVTCVSVRFAAQITSQLGETIRKYMAPRWLAAMKTIAQLRKPPAEPTAKIKF